MRSRLQFFKIATLSFIFCVSVVFGNVSLRYLPVSFNQAIGATTPFFTAVFAYAMTLKREAWLTYLALVPVVTGVIIASGVSLYLLTACVKLVYTYIYNKHFFFIIDFFVFVFVFVCYSICTIWFRV